jgi:DNA-binding response OmpR family regulator
MLRVHEPINVLLIEDDHDEERLALRALQRCGVNMIVKVARDGASALEALRLYAPDLVISDLKLPMLNGDEVLRRARSDSYPHRTPYVMFSSSDEAQDRHRCLAAGADDFITKPVDYTEYQECVRGIIQRWLGDHSGSCERWNVRSEAVAA